MYRLKRQVTLINSRLDHITKCVKEPSITYLSGKANVPPLTESLMLKVTHIAVTAITSQP